MAEVTNKKFVSVVEKLTYSDNQFYKVSKVDGAPAPDVSEIQIPQASSSPAVIVGDLQNGVANNAAANSLAPVNRVYGSTSYSLNTFRTPTEAIAVSDLMTYAYNRRQELLEDHGLRLAQAVADYAAIQFAQDSAVTDLITQTTSTQTRTNIVPGGYAGNVKRVAKEDIEEVLRLFDRMQISGYPGSIYGLITPEQKNDIINIDGFNRYDNTGVNSMAVNGGILGDLYGIRFFVRHNNALNANCVYDASTNTKREYGAALSANETSAAIFFHSGLVRRSEETPRLFLDEADSQYQAHLFSSNVRFGATKSRKGLDGKGVVSLVEATTA